MPRAKPARIRASRAGVGEHSNSSRLQASTAAAIEPSGDRIAAEPFSLLVREQRLDDAVEVAVEDRFQVSGRQADAMIGEAVLGEVIRSDLLAAVAGAHLSAARGRGGFLLFPQLRFVEMRAQQL